MAQQQKNEECVHSGAQIVHHNAGAPRQTLECADRWWLDDIEGAKEQERSDDAYDGEWCRDESERLTGDLVHHDEGGVLAARFSRHDGCRGNASGGGDERQYAGDPGARASRRSEGDQCVDQDRGERSPGTWPRTELPGAEPGGDRPRPAGVPRGVNWAGAADLRLPPR